MRIFSRRAVLLGIASLFGALPAAAQLVTPKTAPVLQDEQWNLYPSAREGMAGVSIALDDSLLDPWVNPAKATRAAGSLFGTPFLHALSERRGGGRTLPVGAIGGVGAWSFGGIGAVQELDRAGPVWNRPTRERTATNRYLSGVAARRLPGGVALGASAFRADLGAIDGVDLLYAGSDRIEQDGSVTDLRIGATRPWAGTGSMELLLIHNRTDMTHDVRFPSFRQWVGPAVPGGILVPERNEHNVDRTHIWGAHAEGSRPVGTGGVRVGWLATANRLSHPKIPNYVFMNIPRDPGTTYGFAAGVGVARITGPVTLGLDLALEPMTSETWADAAADTARVGGGIIPRGGRTVENQFGFLNKRLRLGVGRDFALGTDSASTLGVQMGLGVHAIAYHLDQTNHVLRTERAQDEAWTEWSPTLGVRWRSRGLEVGYAFRVTSGPGGGSGWGGPIGALDLAAPSAGGIIAAPGAPLTMDAGSVVSHKLTVAVPLR